MRYHHHLSLSGHPQSTPSFLRPSTASPITAVVDHDPTDHPDTPTTGPHPSSSPPLRQVPIHSSTTTTPPSTALGPFRIASPGRLYRNHTSSSLSPPVSPILLLHHPSRCLSRLQLRSSSPLSPVAHHPRVPIAINGIHPSHIQHLSPYTTHTLILPDIAQQLFSASRINRINCRMPVRLSHYPTTALDIRFL